MLKSVGERKNVWFSVRFEHVISGCTSVLVKLSVHCPSYYCLNRDGLTLVINQSFSVCFHERVARFPRFIHSSLFILRGGGGTPI